LYKKQQKSDMMIHTHIYIEKEKDCFFFFFRLIILGKNTHVQQRNFLRTQKEKEEDVPPYHFHFFIPQGSSHSTHHPTFKSWREKERKKKREILFDKNKNKRLKKNYRKILTDDCC